MSTSFVFNQIHTIFISLNIVRYVYFYEFEQGRWITSRRFKTYLYIAANAVKLSSTGPGV